jgi:nitrite reductase/ring-hydroxylating ferredoxin subunit
MKQEVLVLESGQLNEGERKVVPLNGTEVGVYRVHGKLYAYQNLCHHQGGPACEGLLMPKVEQVLAADQTYRQRRFNFDDWHIVCPWHAWEYHLETGEYVVNPKIKLKKYEVVERDGGIYVLA